MPKRALVTGAAGFVGAVLARRLLADGHRVELLVRPDSDTWRLDSLDAPRHAVDLTEPAEVKEVVAKLRPDWVFHLAAHGGSSSQKDARRMLQVNVVGTMNLVDACLAEGFEALVHAGSSSEYGYVGHPPEETECPRPNSDYAVTKASATLYCRYAAECHDAPISTLRLYSVYGPYEEPSRFVPTLALVGLEGRLPPLVSPDVARDFVFTDDVADAFVRAAQRAERGRGAIYNVGTGRQVTIGEAVEVARTLFGIEETPKWASMPNRDWDTKTWIADPRKALAELDWEPGVSFEEGLGRFVDWLEEDGGRIALYRRKRGT